MKFENFLGAALLGAGALFGSVGSAQTADKTVQARIVEANAAEMLFEAARIEPLMQVVATEGARHGLKLEESLFPGKGGSSWEMIVGSIQAPERLGRKLADVIREELSPRDIATALEYLEDGPGRRIVQREVQVRREMLDGAKEATALAASRALRDEDASRAALLDELIASLDLVSANVSSGLNANLAFYKGLADGGAMRKRLTESEMLAIVWGQEAEVRDATETWLEGYLTRAYAPLDDVDLREHIAFAKTPSGQRYFAAMFLGFGKVFEETSYDLGRAAADFIVAEDA